MNTAKEVHVYIEHNIQNIASNRKQSINPHFIDMILNNAVLEYIGSKFPDKQSNKDIESTLKRYSDFNVLKVSASRFLEVGTGVREVVLTKIPSDCLKIQYAVCNYKRPYVSSDKTSKPKFTANLTINKENTIPTNLSISFSYIDDSGLTISKTISFDDVVSSIQTKSGIFYLYDSMLDRLRNLGGLDCEFKSLNTLGKDVICIELPLGYTLVSFTCNTNFISITQSTDLVPCVNYIKSRTSSISILSGFECQVALDDYYGSKNLHLNPIAELSNGNFMIYHTDFIPSKVEISYIKKPKLFNIESGQIPEIDISKDFLDFAIKELLLILNSPNFERVVNQNVKNL